MVALAILFVLIAIAVVYCYRFGRTYLARRRAAHKPDPDVETATGTGTETQASLPEMRYPTWSSTADLVTERFSRYEVLYMYDGPPACRACGRDGAHSHSPSHSCPHSRSHHHTSNPHSHSHSHEGSDTQCDCHVAYEMRLGLRTRPVVRGDESDLDLPKYTSHPTSSCPRLVCDDTFPPPPTPPPEAYVLPPTDPDRAGTDLTAAVARVMAQDRRESNTSTSSTSLAPAPATRTESRGSTSSTNSDSSGVPLTPQTSQIAPPAPTARRWSFLHKQHDPRRPPVTFSQSFGAIVPL